MRELPAIFDPWKDKSVARKRQVKKIPGVFDYKRMLYIGANPQRIELVDLFYGAGYEIDVLEVDEKNVINLEKLNRKWHIFSRIYMGEITKVAETFCDEYNEKYDICLWWHGPEHVQKNKLNETIKKIESWTRYLVILGCPWGEYPQEKKGKPYEKHESALYPQDFHRLGYKTETLRKPDKRGSNILAWKKLC